MALEQNLNQESLSTLVGGRRLLQPLVQDIYLSWLPTLKGSDLSLTLPKLIFNNSYTGGTSQTPISGNSAIISIAVASNVSDINSVLNRTTPDVVRSLELWNTLDASGNTIERLAPISVYSNTNPAPKQKTLTELENYIEIANQTQSLPFFNRVLDNEKEKVKFTTLNNINFGLSTKFINDLYLNGVTTSAFTSNINTIINNKLIIDSLVYENTKHSNTIIYLSGSETTRINSRFSGQTLTNKLNTINGYISQLQNLIYKNNTQITGFTNQINTLTASTNSYYNSNSSVINNYYNTYVNGLKIKEKSKLKRSRIKNRLNTNSYIITTTKDTLGYVSSFSIYDVKINNIVYSSERITSFNDSNIVSREFKLGDSYANFFVDLRSVKTVKIDPSDKVTFDNLINWVDNNLFFGDKFAYLNEGGVQTKYEIKTGLKTTLDTVANTIQLGIEFIGEGVNYVRLVDSLSSTVPSDPKVNILSRILFRDDLIELYGLNSSQMINGVPISLLITTTNITSQITANNPFTSNLQNIIDQENVEIEGIISSINSNIFSLPTIILGNISNNLVNCGGSRSNCKASSSGACNYDYSKCQGESSSSNWLDINGNGGSSNTCSTLTRVCTFKKSSNT
jgi:hypothetical protein